MTTTTITTPCVGCGTSFPYEPILCFGKDIGAALPKLCLGCHDKAAGKAAKDAALARVLRNRDHLHATLPPDLLATDKNHAGFNQPLWNAAARWLTTQNQRTLGIIGPAARCKTRVLALMAKTVIERGSRIVWTSAVRLKDAAHDRQSRDRDVSAHARQHLQECLTTPWLFLDDLGKNEWTAAFESQLFQILDHRLNHHLPMAWTANDHPERFHPLMSPLNASPIIGRLLDRCALLDLREEE